MEAKCECCEKEAHIQSGYMCPDNWFYTEININGTSDTIIVCVCSKDCALNIWKTGPGPKLTEKDYSKLRTAVKNLEKVKEIMALVEVTES